jgi:cation diffusion facilitator family transporter
MPACDLSAWQHSHDFLDVRDAARQRRTQWVVALTFGTMVVEIIAGWLTGSMALLADGWHMGSHVAALALAVFVYHHARRQAGNARYTFGPGKLSALGGYSSAMLLALVAALMIGESVARFRAPVEIAYGEALLVACIGLAVNLLSAFWLRDDHHHHHHHHGHAHDHEHDHDHASAHGEGRDHNLEGAFIHVLADALTSVLAIAALLAGRWLGFARLDPAMGIVGALVILVWAWGLAKASARTLLDAEDHEALKTRITETLEADGDLKITDLHVWRLSPAACGVILSLASHTPQPPDVYKRRLADLPGIGHLTVEVNRCGCGG